MPKKLPYRGKQIARLEKRIAKLTKKLDKLQSTSRAFKTEAEHAAWLAQFM